MNATTQAVRMHPHSAAQDLMRTLPEFGPSPLVMEVATPELRLEAVEIALGGLERREQELLIRHPDDLGRRCEAVLSGIAPEELDKLLLPGDRRKLGVIVVGVLRAAWVLTLHQV